MVPRRKTVKKGARSPTALRLRIKSNDASFNASTVTSARVTMTRLEDGSVATWTFTPGPGPEPTTTALAFAFYVLAADGSDVQVLGDYDGAVSLLGTWGEVEGTAIYLHVEAGNV